MNLFAENKKLLFFTGLVLFFVFIRYPGYDCDAAIYLLQTVNYLHPDRFINDVPFMFGNQDSFSVVSPIIALFFKAFGVNAGGMIASFILQLLWYLFFVWLCVKWCVTFKCKRWAMPIVIVSILVLFDKTYGAGTFQNLTVIENYLVARLFSQVFFIAALAFIFNKNKFISLILFFVATAMHPLVGGWGLPLWLFIHYPKLRVPVVAVSLLFPLTGYLHVGRLDFYADDWLSGNLTMTPTWRDSLIYAGFLAFWFVMYRRIKDARLSRFALGVFWMLFIGIYFQYVGSFTEHVFLYQIQGFRVLGLCIIPVIPAFAVYLRERVYSEEGLQLSDVAVAYIGLSSIAQCQWIVPLMAAIPLALIPCKINANAVGTKQKWFYLIFCISLVYLVFFACVNNYIQVFLTSGTGNADWVIKYINAPEKLLPFKQFILVSLALICFFQRRFVLAFSFGFAFCHDKMLCLPLFGIAFYLFPKMSPAIKKVLVALAIMLSFAEVLPSLDGNPILSVVFVITVFALTIGVISFSQEENKKGLCIIFIILIGVLAAWNVLKWDSRSETASQNERQMDVFLDSAVFPQIRDRGKILFVVSNEAPIQSRIYFLTGAYADASIYVGEIFFKEQYKESNRRRAALLWGDSAIMELNDFVTKIASVYANQDTLMQRVDYLCSTGDISHLVSDKIGLPLIKEDSLYLDIRKKWVYLYPCNK